MIPSKDELYSAFEKLHGYELANKISKASVTICGLGGLGSNVALILARSGIGKLTLIDFDKISLSNLNRQQYLFSQIGMYKSDALKKNIAEIAPYTEITTYAERITEENIGRLLFDGDVIIEAFDDAESKAMLVNMIAELYPDKYIVAASGMAGIYSSNGIKTRKITERFFLCGDEVSDISKENTIFSSRVSLCAAHQANMVLRIIDGKIDA